MDRKKDNVKSRRIGLSTISEGLGKLPPQAIELEEAVLGACMLEKDVIITVSQILDPEDFYKDSNQEIYRSIVNLLTMRNPIDIKTVTHELRSRGVLELIGGAHYISELTSKVNSAANIEYHSRIVKEQSIKRSLISIASEIQRDAYEDTIDVFKLLERAYSQLIAVDNVSSTTVKLSEILAETITEIEENKAKRENNEVVGIATGLMTFDKKTGGLQKGDLIIVAARPGMGKTAWVNTLLKNIGVDQNLPVGFLSMEMTNRQTTMREIAHVSEVDIGKLINGKVTDEEMVQVIEMSGELSKGNIYLDETPRLTPYQIRTRAMAWKIKYDIKILFVDYIQIAGDDGDSFSKEEKVSKVSGTLKGIAKELNIPVVGISQLSRAVESRTGDKRPMLSDLRDSGAIEQDADMVIFLYRPEYYNIHQDAKGVSTHGRGEMIVGKYRNGKKTNGWFEFVGGQMKWRDIQGQFPTAPDMADGDDQPF